MKQILMIITPTAIVFEIINITMLLKKFNRYDADAVLVKYFPIFVILMVSIIILQILLLRPTAKVFDSVHKGWNKVTTSVWIAIFLFIFLGYMISMINSSSDNYEMFLSEITNIFGIMSLFTYAAALIFTISKWIKEGFNK
jgi:hypothetical protein